MFCHIVDDSTSGKATECVTAPHYQLLFLFPLVEVALIIEVTEEDDEGEAVSTHHHIHGVGVITFRYKVVARVYDEHHKLHLERQKCRIYFVHFPY